jgi:NAD(P)-dependent dehydrogenase (short-subunit alcohol dehydrogenase family)
VSNLFSLEDRVAIVTGASSGLGAQMARALHDAGASVVIAARRLDRLTALADELPKSLAVSCDVANDDDLDALVDATMTNYGRIDVLVNNAGVGEPIAALDEPLDEFRQTIGVNLTATFALCQKAGRHMLTTGSGSIINVASILGMVGAGMFASASYASSKGAVIQLTRDLAAQWARGGVRVNALAPGWFETEMTADMFADEKAMTLVRRKTPMARPGMPGELDGALVYLASDASSFMTGQVMAVDGGWTAI